MNRRPDPVDSGNRVGVFCFLRVEKLWHYLRTFVVALFLATVVGTAAYAVNPPTITPGTGVYISAQPTATITGDMGATFYYTLDGSTPTTSSTQYTGAFSIANPATIKAIAFISPNSSTVTSAYVQFDPNSAPVTRTNLLLWLKSDFGFVTSSNQISRWVDLSGSGNDGTQNTSANQPTVVSNAINGWPAAKFSSASSQNLQLPTGFSTFTGGSIFIVAQPASVTAGARLLDLANGATSDNIQVQLPNSTSLAFYVYNGSTPTNVTGSSAVTLNLFQLWEMLHNGTATATLLTNGVQQQQSTTMNNITNISRADNFVSQGSAGGNYFNGQISEILIYNTAVTASQQAALEAYFAQRYQVANQTPNSPIISVAAGTLTGPTQVAIAAAPNATVHITQDGSTPTSASPIYAGPVNVYYSQTLKAIAIANGVSSSVSSAAYTLNSTQWPAPNSADTSSLQVNLQLPVISAP